MEGDLKMTQSEILDLLRAFGPLEAKEIVLAGVVARKTAVHELRRAERKGDAWRMYGTGQRGGRCLWGAV